MLEVIPPNLAVETIKLLGTYRFYGVHSCGTRRGNS
jgi:hypothetical protein